MSATSLPTIIGLIAGCLSSWSLVPQLLKCWREGLTEAVSKKMFADARLWPRPLVHLWLFRQ